MFLKNNRFPSFSFLLRQLRRERGKTLWCKIMKQPQQKQPKKYQVIVKQRPDDIDILGMEYVDGSATMKDLQQIGKDYGFDGISIRETKSLDVDCYLTAIELSEMSAIQRRLFGNLGTKESAGVAG